MSGKLRIGFVGAGAIVRDRHLPGLRKRSEVELVAVCNSTPESTRRAAQEFGIPEVEGCWQDLVARKDLDVIWIGTTPHLHAEVTLAALASGKHVFCQARMAMDLESAKAMYRASREHPDLVTMLCPPPHGMKHGRYFRKLLAERRAGELRHFRLEAFSDVWSDASKPLHWRQDRNKSGLNMLSVGIYAEVLGQWIGQPEEIQARCSIVQSRQGGVPVEVPDLIQVLGRWPGAVAGSLEWSGVARYAPPERLTCYGTRGTLVYEFGTERILAGVDGENELKLLEVPAGYVDGWDVEDRFVGAVLGGLKPEPGFETGVKYMAWLEAIHRSSGSGCAVSLMS